MIDFNTEALCPSVQTLIDNKVASRVRAKMLRFITFRQKHRSALKATWVGQRLQAIPLRLSKKYKILRMP